MTAHFFLAVCIAQSGLKISRHSDMTQAFFDQKRAQRGGGGAMGPGDSLLQILSLLLSLCPSPALALSLSKINKH